jgi:hypothetical protein
MQRRFSTASGLRQDDNPDSLRGTKLDLYTLCKAALVPPWQGGTSLLLLGYQTQRMMLGNCGG